MRSGLDHITKKVQPTFAKISYDIQLVDYIQKVADKRVHKDKNRAEKHHSQKLKNIRGFKSDKTN